ncbi:MAG: type I DNA topoisomerase [Cryomorphaceae bacterium]|jgi:DNA topoisomerase-1|nr:type I DNA topoisomerase [Cryomorphaceae bacterium]MBT3503811.1 type I DNA topoisomerase [Cryomorphaceae bacterium]MBT3688833.1 type I DNA topoisomerase [Cryomorphaceae bacterium]MBT7019189.1 type I DNA topoisomerase [Cryomorphaceae bacterium]MBT7547018.1 type I DNA topoisomerase [Cryomorphaceae bacterium]
MPKNLVIVESATKAKTIEKILGQDYKVVSCVGHISDLPVKELGVDVENDFRPKYVVPTEKKPIIRDLKKYVKDSDKVWLASDEDREGEAIAWHLYENLDLSNKDYERIVFHEITKNAILKALESPREINFNLVNAQQARRVLDRLVGYELSPVLWRKVKAGLSAGRVQSVSVRLIVEKEREIKTFISKSSYKSIAVFETESGAKLKAELNEKYSSVDEVKGFFEKNYGSLFNVASTDQKPGKKSPTPPFTTSTLQQEASRKLGFGVTRTMSTAQKLYEAGLITYMRTDSVTLSNDAKSSIVKKIETKYGNDYVNLRDYKNKNKSAQEAHEAVRPTDINVEEITSDYDQQRLYDLIWKRTISSQMSDAQIERTVVNIKSNSYNQIFIARGEVIKFDGFLRVYNEGTDDEVEEEKDVLPILSIDEQLNLLNISSKESFSRPPSRYTEASLVKKLEELGIGRPATYATTISTIQNRGYIAKGANEGVERTFNFIEFKQEGIKESILKEKTGSNKGKLVPTDIGMIVNDFLVDNFNNILDYGFTAEVEKNFDKIASGDQNWTDIIKQFYSDFHENVNEVRDNAERQSGEKVLGPDPSSGRVVKVRLGKFGPIAQIGSIDEEEKPVFASLTKDQQLDTITLEEALELFKFPKEIGSYKDEIVTVNNGRYGPYIKFSTKSISIPNDLDPHSVEISKAIELIDEKLKAEEPVHIYNEIPVTKGKGRFGPFIKWNDMFINVNKSYDFDNLSINEIEELIELKIKKEKEKLISHWTDEDIKVEKGRWGRSIISKGKKKVEIPKEIDPKTITLEIAKQYLNPKKKK